LRQELRGVLVPGATRTLPAPTAPARAERPALGAAILASVRGSVGRAVALGALVMLVVFVMFAFASSLAATDGATEPAAELDAVPLESPTVAETASAEPQPVAPPADDDGTAVEPQKSNPGNGGDPPGKAKGRGNGRG